MARAIRRRHSALIDPYDGACYQIYWELRRIPRMNTGFNRYVYGDEEMIQWTVDALAEGTDLKIKKKQRVRDTLKNFDPAQ